MAAVAAPPRQSIAAAGGVVIVLAAWEIVGRYNLVGGTIAPPSVVAEVLGGATKGAKIWTAAMHTTRSALTGFAWGAVLAVFFGSLVTMVPWLRRGVDRMATAQSAMPFVALGPILMATFERSTVPTAMSTATVFFTLYMAFVSGLGAAPTGLHEVFRVYGASSMQRLLRVQLPAALPVIASGLKIAMPLSMVGAVIGEWFGSSAGIGPILLMSLRDYDMDVMWAAATSTVLVTLALYGFAALIERAAFSRFGT